MPDGEAFGAQEVRDGQRDVQSVCGVAEIPRGAEEVTGSAPDIKIVQPTGKTPRMEAMAAWCAVLSTFHVGTPAASASDRIASLRKKSRMPASRMSPL
jgi:hypothetical protein